MRAAFFVVLCVTLLVLLVPGSWVTDFNNWVATWLPFSRQLDSMDASHHADKLVHATLFACMGFLAVRGWTQRRQLLGVLWLAPQTEWLQTYIPGRGASLGDVLADVLGLAVGVVLALLLRRRHQRRAANIKPRSGTRWPWQSAAHDGLPASSPQSRS